MEKLATPDEALAQIRSMAVEDRRRWRRATLLQAA